MSILRQLIDLISSISPTDVKKVFDFITKLIEIFGAKGFQATGTAPTAEENEAVEALVAKGCGEAESRRLVRALNG